jgi:nucleotide-binding universal stress UspA family protein
MLPRPAARGMLWSHPMKILAALDGSPRSENVLTTAIALARGQGGRVFLVRAIGLVGEIPQDSWKSTDEPLLDVIDRRAREYLAECRERIPAECRGEARVAVGSPSDSICEAAKSLGADLVVVGSHGYGTLEKLLGTTTTKVVNHCPCSVLVVKEA